MSVNFTNLNFGKTEARAEAKAGDVALDQETKAALSNIADLLREGGAAAAVDGEESATQTEFFTQKQLEREDAAKGKDKCRR